MNTPPRRISETGLYKPVWRELNRLIDYVREISPVGGRNILQRRTMNGTLTVAEATNETTESLTVKRFKITGLSAEYVTASEWDGTNLGASQNIAKPIPLRVSSFNGLTIGDWSYSGTSDDRTLTFAGTPVAGGLQTGDRIEEKVDRPYAVDQEIWATEPDGGTGVSGTTWQDLNIEARRWRAIRTLVQVCKRINGVDTVWYMVVDGGPVFQRGN